MGRIIAFDTGVKNGLDKILEYKHAQTCLIIGQHTVQRDVVVHLCPIPPKEKPSEQLSGASDDPGTAKENQPPKGKQTKNPDDELELDDLWICHFSKEVTRTLPGGFEVLGLLVIATSDTVNKLQQKLRQILFAVFKVLGKDQELSICQDVRDRVLLHFCTVSKKFVCRTYDVSNAKSTPNPAEWKQLPNAPTWLSLESQLAIDLKFAVSSEDNASNVKKHIDSALSPIFKNIKTATPVINGLRREEEELLVSADGKKSKQKINSHEQNFNIDLLVPMVQNENEHSKTSSCGMMLTFKGTIHCRAFIHNKATVKEAIQAIKQDIIRSITARCEIHCEDLLVIDEEQQDPVVVYELPKRVFAPLNQSGIQVCDYQFHGDTASDSLTAFKELLNLDLDEEDVEACELAPATSDLIQPEVMEDRLSEFGDTPPPKKSVLFPVASVAVAAVAAGLSYLLFVQNSSNIHE